MPYSPEHAQKTKVRITEAARVLFNLHGFDKVTIEMVMARAGLTRGGFYRHFDSKEALYGAAVQSFLMGKGAEWRADAGVDPTSLSPEMCQHMLDSYLSDKHLGALEDQCPMIALPSDVARQSPEVQRAYQNLLTAMVWLFESTQDGAPDEKRYRALAMSALCVGGMVLARSIPDSDLSDEVRAAAYRAATSLNNAQGEV